MFLCNWSLGFVIFIVFVLVNFNWDSSIFIFVFRMLLLNDCSLFFFVCIRILFYLLERVIFVYVNLIVFIICIKKYGGYYKFCFDF